VVQFELQSNFCGQRHTQARTAFNKR
jgi:hypothetical protein